MYQVELKRFELKRFQPKLNRELLCSFLNDKGVVH